MAESGLHTLPVQVLRYVENSADAAVAALSVILILISLVVVVVVERVMGLRKALRYGSFAGHPIQSPKTNRPIQDCLWVGTGHNRQLSRDTDYVFV